MSSKLDFADFWEAEAKGGEKGFWFSNSTRWLCWAACKLLAACRMGRMSC